MIVLGILLVASDICPDDDVQLDDDKVPSVRSKPRGRPRDWHQGLLEASLVLPLVTWNESNSAEPDP